MLSGTVAGCTSPAQLRSGPAEVPEVSLISQGKIAYPMDMFKASIRGRVVVDCGIAADGTTHDCRIVRSSNVGFNATAMALARSCVFRGNHPGTLPLDHHEWTLTWNIAA